MIDGLFIHEFGPRLLCVGDGTVQVGDLDPDRISRDVTIEVQFEVKSGYERASPMFRARIGCTDTGVSPCRGSLITVRRSSWSFERSTFTGAIEVSSFSSRFDSAKSDQFQAPGIALACSRSGDDAFGQL